MVFPEIHPHYRVFFAGAFCAAPDLAQSPDNPGMENRAYGGHPYCFQFDILAGFRTAVFRIAGILPPGITLRQPTMMRHPVNRAARSRENR